MSGAIERTFSVDDLVGGIWRLGQAGMGRTDSEAAFQEFLKRIPSASNLAAAAAQAETASAQYQLQSSSAAAPTLSTAAPLIEAGTAGSGAATAPAGLAGIPRVPSLDFLRQLVSPQYVPAPMAAGSAPAVKLEATTGENRAGAPPQLLH